MKLSSNKHALIASVLTIVAIAVGCQKEAATVTQPAARPQSASVGPEESFEAIVESFRSGVEEVAIGFVVPDDAGGHSRMTGRNEVSSELIPPAKDSDPYKGVITVRSEARYSLQRSKEEPNESEKTDEQGGSAFPDEGSDTEVFNPALVGAPDATRTTAKPGKGDVMIASEVNTSERKYELVYEKGRWVLTTKLDPKTEKSIQHAFDRALESQS